MLTFFVVVFAAIVFEYSNGFHDAANAIATVVSSSLSSGKPETRADSPAIGPQNHSR